MCTGRGQKASEEIVLAPLLQTIIEAAVISPLANTQTFSTGMSIPKILICWSINCVRSSAVVSFLRLPTKTIQRSFLPFSFSPFARGCHFPQSVETLNIGVMLVGFGGNFCRQFCAFFLCCDAQGVYQILLSSLGLMLTGHPASHCTVHVLYRK